MKISCITVLLVVFFTAEAFSASDAEWFEGSLVLKSRKVLRGQLSLEPQYNVVLFKVGEEMMVFPAHKVESFYYYDGEENINRKFVSLQQRLGAFTQHQLYEVVVYGEISVLRRQRVLSHAIHIEVQDYEYFIRSNEGLIPLRKFRSRVYPEMRQRSESLVSYVRENRLNPNIPADAIRIIDFFNANNDRVNTVAKY
jgi:hypothetical protein